MKIIKQLSLLTLLSLTGTISAMERPEPTQPPKVLLSAILKNDLPMVLQCVNENNMHLSTDDIQQWARHYYSTKASVIKYNIAKLALLNAHFNDSVPSLVQLAAKKVAEQKDKGTVNLQLLPQELRDAVHTCPLSLPHLQSQCTNLTKPEAFYLSGDTELCDSNRAATIQYLHCALRNFATERTRKAYKIAQIFNQIYAQCIIAPNGTTTVHEWSANHQDPRVINVAPLSDVDQLFLWFRNEQQYMNECYSPILTAILDASLLKEAWLKQNTLETKKTNCMIS